MSLDGPTLTVDLDRVAHNWRVFAARGAAGAVLKADAYGLGAAQVGARLLAEGARDLFVATAAEGCRLYHALADAPGAPVSDARLWVLNGHADLHVSVFRSHAMRPVLNSLEEARVWAREADGAPCALQLDTGMNRLGLSASELDDLLAETDTLGALNIAHVMSHFAQADGDSAADAACARQAARFEAGVARLRPHLADGVTCSLANSAGALRSGDYLYDLSRPGIGLYGGSPFADAADPRGGDLQIPIRLTAPILTVRDTPPGEAVGYGGDFAAQTPRRIATVAAGYADGFLRSAGGEGYGVLAGRRAPVVGRVSMDLLAIDVTGHGAAARRNAHVELLGPSAGLEEQARRAGTISYESLARLAPRVMRVYAPIAGPISDGEPAR